MSTATPQDRVRASILLTILPLIAERILQYDKANPSYRLADLQSDDEHAIYCDAAEALLTEGRVARMVRLNLERGHLHALAENEQQAVDKQAREAVARFGHVRPGHCWVCRQRIISDAATLLISASLKADVHGMCCAKNDARYELTANFSYRLIGRAK